MPPVTTPLPPPSTAATNKDGSPTVGFAGWFQAISQLLSAQTWSWSSINATSALTENNNEVLTVAGGRTLTGGFQETEFSLGSPANAATITPNPSDSLKQVVTNNVAGFTIAATAQVGDVELRVINGASAGTITFSGFDKQFTGDPLDTTNGHQFLVIIYGFGAKKAFIIKALQ